MGKRSRSDGGQNGKRRKFQLASGMVEPGQYGVYATCPKHKEAACRRELGALFTEKFEEYYSQADQDQEDDDEDEEELSIEDAIKKEVAELKDTSKEAKKAKKITEVNLGCECLVFIKCRRPIVPSELVEKICAESLEKDLKSTRFTQRLAPIDASCSASIDELKKLATEVLKPHFHKEADQKPYKFAITVNKRNFNQIDKMDIIKNVAAIVGNDRGHKVDLKNYDKLILIECFKSNIGMSVVDNFDKYYKFNLQQIFESKGKDTAAETTEKAEDQD